MIYRCLSHYYSPPRNQSPQSGGPHPARPAGQDRMRRVLASYLANPLVPQWLAGDQAQQLRDDAGN